MTLFDKIRAAVFRDPQVVGKKKGAESPTEVIGGVEVFKVGAKEPPTDPPSQPTVGQSRRRRGR